MRFTLKVLFWTVCAAITVASLAPLEYMPEITLNWWDKAQHALAFAVLGILGFVAYPRSSRVRLCLGLLALGAVIEIAQGATGWRDGDMADLVADAVGLACALLFDRSGTLAGLCRRIRP